MGKRTETETVSRAAEIVRGWLNLRASLGHAPVIADFDAFLEVAPTILGIDAATLRAMARVGFFVRTDAGFRFAA